MTATRPPLRLWPGVVIAVAQVALWLAGPVVFVEADLPVGVIASVFGAAATLVWWLLFSRAAWLDRLGALVLMAVALWATSLVLHASIAGAGQGMLFYIMAVPAMTLALVAWAAATRSLGEGGRRAMLAVVLVLASAPFALMRTSGIRDGGAELHWRWTPTPEERLLASEISAVPPVQAAPPETQPATPSEPDVREPAAAPVAVVPHEAPAPAAAAVDARGDEDAVRAPAWPGFRGPARDGIVRGVRISTDWAAAPPVALWRRPVGPGWSSFAVDGDLLYTQEQRGDDEMVACYRVSTGEPVWQHRDPVRFWESNGGAGPRATPTVHGGRVFAFGATGVLNALDAATGARLWSRQVAEDTGRQVPGWGFASSPLVIDDVVIVAAAGTLAAYDLATGAPRWQGPSYGGSYSSPHRAVIDGIVQVVLLGGPGAIGLAPDTGAVLWEHAWSPGPIVQPGLMPDGDLLINALASTGGLGIRRLHLSHSASGWDIEERWTSRGLKPYFNDFVVHNGHAYGFDGSILSSINLEDGERNWKGGRYGNGQMILLADQDLLLVLSEDGELVLVSATPDAHTEIARARALDAKTWNHPVVIGDLLLIRNGEEMAAFRLPIPALTATR
ncbi:MAG: PQQ-binding-like beta-propeller repeat protein [Vicinamibacterales bacterium]|nr:PQQ-binding-like beta-propeller repeat protein [Vicinamibacterales bacterium]